MSRLQTPHHLPVIHMEDEIWAAAITGVLAGLGVAMPLGAIGVLLLRDSLLGGFRVGAACAAGIATVDLVYCAVATGTGALLTRMIEQHEGHFLVASGTAIVAIGFRQLHQSLKDRGPTTLDAPRSSALAGYLRFAGLTAINPMTLVYFVALGAAVTANDDSWAAAVVFVLAAGMSSLAWQLGLALTGSFFSGVIGNKTTRLIGIAASLLIVVLGSVVLLGGVRQ